MNQNKIRNILNFYQEVNQLKELMRSGWLKWHVNRDKLESVADHIYGVAMLAIIINSEYNLGLDINKVIKMILLHELEEVKIGDITPYDSSHKLQLKQEQGYAQAINLLNKLNNVEEHKSILKEYYQRRTKEAIFANRCDKLEAILQADIYNRDCDINSEQNKDMLDRVKKSGIKVDSSDDLLSLFIKDSLSKNYFDDDFLTIVEELKKS